MIAFFLPNLRAGGAERVMLHLLQEFNTSSREEVVLVLGKKQGELLGQVPEGIPIVELGHSSALRSVFPFIRFCQKYRPEKVFATLGSSLAASLAKPFISRKIEIINRLGNTIGAEKLLLRSGIKQFLYSQANRIIAKNSDKLIFQCQYMAEDYIAETGVTPKSYQVIYNPVNIEKAQHLKKEPNTAKQDFVAIGRLSAQKDYDTLINAFDLLINKYNKKYVVRILGEGDLRNPLQEKISEKKLMRNVILEGFTPNPYSYLQNSKALISTSLFEGFSNVIVEALCIGVPVIASDCPGANAEVLREGKNGFLFETGNAEDLAKVIMNNYEKISRLGRKEISEQACERFNLERIFWEYKSYLEQ